MDDIYEDIVRVGNNLDTLNIKREELQNQPDLNQNRNLSQVQPIPMHVSSQILPYYARIPKCVKVNEVFIENHLMSARHDPLGRSSKFGVILVVIDFWR